MTGTRGGRRGRRERRDCRQRVRYATREAALAEAQRLVKETKVERTHHVYQCVICGGYHISGRRRGRDGRVTG